ncbi:L-ribulose-5-phosphate 4-epimerase [Blautia sp. AF34-10]|nr:L-ribulose-5-phosphate 4-epimerase [Blautia sp. AF34-10]RHP35985.1 L-ribulose-5-phosphate 4-epimerase [Blautia sp. AF34-10]
MGMDAKTAILEQKTALGIEFGSTRIKAVLIGADNAPIASGDHEWENRYDNGVWTYTLEDIWTGLQDAYTKMAADVKEKYDITLTRVGAIGFSAMMHGYMAFDKAGNLLVPFRTWRNNITEEASEKLTDLFGFHIPQRWTIAHLYQAILNGEPHVADIDYVTTLAGYIQWKMTGERVVGVGEASGIFPIDSETNTYFADMIAKFDEAVADKAYSWKALDVLPHVLTAGDNAGVLTKEGAALLDMSGNLEAGIPLCPPEGDAGTGMAATNSVRVRTGNVSAGTSVFAMIVLEKNLSKVYPEIDMVTTPSGHPVAMVHCQNCTSDLNAWVNLFREFAQTFGMEISTNDLFGKLYNKALEGDADCGGLLAYNYFSGEHVTGFNEGRPVFARTPDAKFNLANFMRVNLFTSLGALKVGLDILMKEEHVQVDQILGHGGLFKTKGVGQKILAGAIDAPVSVMETAGEGGAWGIALLASYMINKEENETLEDYLDAKVFAGNAGTKMDPDPADVAGFEVFTERYKKGLPIERAAVESLNEPSFGKDREDNTMLEELKKRVYEANMLLPKYGLVTFTWGNVSEIDRESGLFVIKPSGVDYDLLTPDDMVVMDLNGNKVEGRYRPSSDTPTHLELYKAFPEIGGIVHTHSSYATSWAQAGRSIPCYGTTHADYIYGEVPCLRCLTKEEIDEAYEENTGHLIVNEFKRMGKDVKAVPAVLCKNHGPFTWGKDAHEAVHNAVVLEEVAKMAYRAETINPRIQPAPQELQDKHYYRKHGANAYYGQN